MLIFIFFWTKKKDIPSNRYKSIKNMLTVRPENLQMKMRVPGTLRKGEIKKDGTVGEKSEDAQ